MNNSNTEKDNDKSSDSAMRNLNDRRGSTERNVSKLSLVSAICKNYELLPPQTYSRCEHLQADHEKNDCGDIWCNKCLNICIFCVDCSNEISKILNEEKKGGENNLNPEEKIDYVESLIAENKLEELKHKFGLDEITAAIKWRKEQITDSENEISIAFGYFEEAEKEFKKIKQTEKSRQSVYQKEIDKLEESIK